MNRRRRRFPLFSIYGHFPKLDVAVFDPSLPLHVFNQLAANLTMALKNLSETGAKLPNGRAVPETSESTIFAPAKTRSQLRKEN